MCKTPIVLRNPCKNFDDTADRLFISAPCNHCSECNNNKRFQWQVRVYYQYLECIEKGGFVIFMTMTYDDFHLPLVKVDKKMIYKRDNEGSIETCLVENNGSIKEVSDIVEDSVVMSCFSKKDIQDFTKAVNTDVKRLYPCTEFKYFVSSEYGDDKLYVSRRGIKSKGTHRPHYHGLFFFTGEIPFEEAKRILSRHWKGELKRQPLRDKNCRPLYDEHGRIKTECKLLGTHRGLIDFTSRKGVITEKGRVDGVGAIGYVCKYVQKDLNNDEILRKHLEHFAHGDFCFGDAKPRELLPFNMQSAGMGMYVVDYTNFHSPGLIEQGKCKFPMYKQGSKEIEYQVIDLPLYVERKVFCYDQKETPNRAYIYNEEGIKMLTNRAVAKRQNLVDKIEDLLRNYNDQIDNDVLCQISLKANRHYLRPLDFIEDLKSNMGYFSVKQLVDYAILLKDYININENNELVSSQYVSEQGLTKQQNNTNGQYVYDVLECELTENEFIDILQNRLRKRRDTNYFPSQTQSSFMDILRYRVMHAQIERALYLYSCYQYAINTLSEEAVKAKIATQNRMSYFLRTRKYGNQLSLIQADPGQLYSGAFPRQNSNGEGHPLNLRGLHPVY